MEKILEVKNAVYEYRNKYQTVKAVNDFSFEFERGKLYAVVGKSGCGKTTLLAMLAGWMFRKKGRLCIKGKILKR